MRVTASTYYKDYAKSVQDLHSELNKNMNQVSTERKYEDADENPLAYYQGKRLDNLKNTAQTQDTLIKMVTGRLEQQEDGARLIEQAMNTVNKEVLQLRNDSSNGNISTINTLKSDFEERLKSITQDMNATYENYYVYGGNDTTTVPFALDIDLKEPTEKADGSVDKSTMSGSSITLTYSHKFPGDTKASTMSMKYTMEPNGKLNISYSGTGYNANGEKIDLSNSSVLTGDAKPSWTTPTEEGADLTAENPVLNKLVSAMSEQGRMQLGYGSLHYRETLPDTYTNGLNMLSGLTGEQMQDLSTAAYAAGSSADDIAAAESAANVNAGNKANMEFLRNPIALISKSILTTQNYTNAYKVANATGATDADKTAASAAKDSLNDDLGEVIDAWTPAQQRLESTYQELGVKQELLNTTQSHLQSMEDTYTTQYKDILGIDTYDAIVQMFSKQYAYNAAMKVGSHVMQSSLFDYVNG